MKKRISSRKKTVQSRAKQKTPNHLRVHMVLVYTSGGIFAITILFVLIHTVVQPFSVKIGSTNVLGASILAEKGDSSGGGEQGDQQQSGGGSNGSGDQSAPPPPTVAPDSIKVQTQTEGKKSETEIETSDGQKIKTKVEDDGSAKIEVEHKDLKIHYEIHDGTISATAEDQKGNEVELDKNKLNEAENTLEEDGIKIASDGAGQITFGKNKVAARTHFPLSIDTGTHQLVVTTPAGTKVVTVLPDQAVENMLATGVINALAPTGSGTDSGIVEFTVENNEPVYKVEGLKKFKFLGFIPVSQPVTAVVSSQTGSEIKTEEPFFTKFVDLLSP